MPIITGNQKVEIVGTITNEGIECMAVRGDDGMLYTIAHYHADGTLSWNTSGFRVRVEGEVARTSHCDQGTTLVNVVIFRADD
jgi:hypothetical protein